MVNKIERFIWRFKAVERSGTNFDYGYIITPPCDAESACRLIIDHIGEDWKVTELELREEHPIIVGEI